MANHHFLLFVPDDPVKLNLPNPGLANCTAIPGMKIITIGGDAGPEIKYRKNSKSSQLPEPFIIKWIYESLSPPFAQAGVASKYIDCLTNMVYHKKMTILI